MNANGCHFCHMGEFSHTHLFHTLFHVRCIFVRLPHTQTQPKEVVDAPSLKAFEARLDVALGSLVIAGRLKLYDHCGPFQLRPFYDSMTSCVHENYRVQIDWKKGRWNLGIGSPAPSWVHGERHCDITGWGMTSAFIESHGQPPPAQLRDVGQSLCPGGHCWSSALGDSHLCVESGPCERTG